MKISFSCSHCGAEIRTPAEWAGRPAACPGCRARVVVPAAAQPDKPAARGAAKPAPVAAAGKAAQKPASSPPEPPKLQPDQGLYEIGSIEDVRPVSAARDPDDEENPSAINQPVQPTDHVRFSCPSCRVVIRAPKTVAGKKSRCPECKERLVIPEMAEPEKDDDLFEVEAAPDSRVHKRDEDQHGLGPTKVADAPIVFDCQSCGTPIKAPRAMAGRKCRCPGCRTQVFVPQPAAGEESIEIRMEAPAAVGTSLQWKEPAEDGPGLGPTGAAPREKPAPFVRFNCGHCGSPIRAPGSVAGKKSHCPSCKGEVRIPKLPAPGGEESLEIQLLDGPVRRKDKPSESSAWEEVRKAASGGSAGVRTHIRFTCEHCGAGIKVALQYEGKKSRCPSCKGRVRIPKGLPPDTSPEQPIEIDLMPMDSDDERRITQDLSRQTGAKTLSGRPVGDDVPDGQSLSDDAGTLIPLDSSDDLEQARGGRAAEGPGAKPPGTDGQPPKRPAAR